MFSPGQASPLEVSRTLQVTSVQKRIMTSFCLQLSSLVDCCECDCTQTAGWSVGLNVTPIKTFVLKGSEQQLLEHESLTCDLKRKGTEKASVTETHSRCILWPIWHLIERDSYFFKGRYCSFPPTDVSLKRELVHPSAQLWFFSNKRLFSCALPKIRDGTGHFICAAGFIPMLNDIKETNIKGAKRQIKIMCSNYFHIYYQFEPKPPTSVRLFPSSGVATVN